MSRRPAKRAFAARPSDADTWVRTRDALSSRESEASLFTARLTIDVTPEQRAASRSPPSRADRPSPTCCASCSRANSPTKTETRNERQRSSPQAVK